MSFLDIVLNKDISEEKEYWLESRVKCPECKCIRKIKNCQRYIETESWEMPWIKYEVCVCPKCGSDMEERDI